MLHEIVKLLLKLSQVMLMLCAQNAMRGTQKEAR